MSARITKALAWSLCAGAAALLAIAYVLPALGTSPGSDRLFESIFTLMILTYAIVGAVVAARRPENPIGWFFAAFALCAAGVAAASEYAEFDPAGRASSLPGYSIGAWIGEWVTLPTAGLLVFVLLLFPTGRSLSPRWLMASWFAAGSLGGATLCAAFKPGSVGENSRRAENPFALDGTGGETLSALAPVFDGLSFATLVLGAAAILVRFRRSRRDERLQLKWLACAAGLAGAAVLGSILGGATGVDVEPLFYVALTGFALIPVAAGTAILRHRLYDIDLVIRRTLVYGALTATLGAAYLASVLLVGLAVGRSGLAVAVSTLAVAGLFGPARARIQALVDRRFYRRRYDAAQTLEAFGGRLRDEIDLEALGADLRGVVQNTVQPTHVSLWLRRRS